MKTRLLSHLAAAALAGLAACANADPLNGGGADASSVDGAPGFDAPPRPDASTITSIVINEFVFQHSGTDIDEYVEVAVPSGADFSAASLLFVEGDVGNNPGDIQLVLPVGAPDGNFWVSDFLDNQLENGSLSALLVDNFSGAAGDDIDADDDGLVDPQPPWELLFDAVGVTDGDNPDDKIYSRAALSPDYDGLGFPVGGASRVPDGVDTDGSDDWVRNDFDGAGLPCCTGVTADPGEALNTPGAPNQVAP